MKLNLIDVTTILETTYGVANPATETPIPELGLDSIEIVGMIYEIEERYGVDLVSESSLLTDMATTSLSGLVTTVNEILAARTPTEE